MMYFTPESLEDIARKFDARARECIKRAEKVSSKSNKLYYNGQADVWSEAAQILRTTKPKEIK